MSADQRRSNECPEYPHRHPATCCGPACATGFRSSPRSFAAVARAEQPARHGAAPDDARLVAPARFKRPDQLRGPVHRLAPAVKVIEPFGLCRIGGRGDFLPRLAALVAPVQLDAEMAMIERRIVRAVTRVMQGRASRCRRRSRHRETLQPPLPRLTVNRPLRVETRMLLLIA